MNLEYHYRALGGLSVYSEPGKTVPGEQGLHDPREARVGRVLQ